MGLELIEIRDPHQYLKPVNVKVEPYETAEWITTEPTLKDCKQIILDNFNRYPTNKGVFVSMA